MVQGIAEPNIHSWASMISRKSRSEQARISRKSALTQKMLTTQTVYVSNPNKQCTPTAETVAQASTHRKLSDWQWLEMQLPATFTMLSTLHQLCRRCFISIDLLPVSTAWTGSGLKHTNNMVPLQQAKLKHTNNMVQLQQAWNTQTMWFYYNRL